MMTVIEVRDIQKCDPANRFISHHSTSQLTLNYDTHNFPFFWGLPYHHMLLLAGLLLLH